MKTTFSISMDFDYDSDHPEKLVDELFDLGKARGWDQETIAVLVEDVQTRLSRLTENN